MSDAYISPNHTTIGEYRISETLFDSTRLDSVLDNLILSASNLYLSAADVSVKVDRITTELESVAS